MNQSPSLALKTLLQYTDEEVDKNSTTRYSEDAERAGREVEKIGTLW